MKKSKKRRKKLSKKELKNINKTLYNVMYFFIFNMSLILLVYSVALYYIGFHNMDLGHNVNIINLENNVTYVDIANDFSTWTSTEMYIHGSNQMDRAFFRGMIAAFFLGMCYLNIKWR